MSLAITPSSFLATGDQNVGLFPMPSELTVAQAAKILDMSADCMDGLLHLGTIKYREDGGVRFIKHSDLIEYEQECERRYAGLEEIVRLDQEVGLYDD